MFLMKRNVTSVLYFAVNNWCQWKSHKGSEGSQRAPRGWVSDAASLGAMQDGCQSWKGALPMPESQFPGWPGTIRPPFPSPQSPPWPLEACPCPWPCWWPLFPQPLGKLCCSSTKIPSLGESILCTAQLHPSTLKTFQATSPNSSPVVTQAPGLCLCLSAASLLLTPAAEQPGNVSSSVCFQTQAGCFQHIPSFSCEQTTV